MNAAEHNAAAKLVNDLTEKLSFKELQNFGEGAIRAFLKDGANNDEIGANIRHLVTLIAPFSSTFTLRGLLPDQDEDGDDSGSNAAGGGAGGGSGSKGAGRALALGWVLGHRSRRRAGHPQRVVHALFSGSGKEFLSNDRQAMAAATLPATFMEWASKTFMEWASKTSTSRNQRHAC